MLVEGIFPDAGRDHPLVDDTHEFQLHFACMGFLLRIHLLESIINEGNQQVEYDDHDHECFTDI